MELYEKVKLIVDYLNENKNAFSPLEKEVIFNHIGIFNTSMSIPSIVLQVYDELGILPDNKNIYKSFIKLLDNKFDISNKNIVEIGGGHIPRLGKRIALMQNRGTITVYDPNLYITNTIGKKVESYNDYPNLKLVKRRFYPISNVDDADIIIGLMPCGAVESITKSAIRHNKDFMVVMCDDCNPQELFDPIEENEDWKMEFINRLEKEVEDSELGKLKVKFRSEIGNQFPIIYNSRG